MGGCVDLAGTVGKMMNKKEVVEETIKLLGNIQLPVSFKQQIDAIQGGIRNLVIVVKMIDKEEEENGKDDSADGSN